jgi:hypothetical protein
MIFLLTEHLLGESMVLMENTHKFLLPILHKEQKGSRPMKSGSLAALVFVLSLLTPVSANAWVTEIMDSDIGEAG